MDVKDVADTKDRKTKNRTEFWKRVKELPWIMGIEHPGSEGTSWHPEETVIKFSRNPAALTEVASRLDRQRKPMDLDVTFVLREFQYDGHVNLDKVKGHWNFDVEMWRDERTTHVIDVRWVRGEKHITIYPLRAPRLAKLIKGLTARP